MTDPTDGKRQAEPATLYDLVRSSRVIVCCGPGGVGKTTCAAALAIAGALIGRHTCVITVDPARRLADALATGALGNTPERIEGPWPGTLDAMALDVKATFDDLIRRNAAGEDQVERILDNRLYQNLVSSLSGTQEYMATEKLHELLDSGTYELVVVDTPPSRNALDFLAAPERLSGFLDNRIMRLLLAPARTGMRAAGFAGELLLRQLGRVAGAAIVDDTVAFFRAFSGMEDGFRERANVVAAILESPATAYVLVAIPRVDAIREVEFFADELRARELAVSAAVLNRVQPDPGPPIDSSTEPPELRDSAWGELTRNLEELRSIVASERESGRLLAEIVEPAPVTVLPLAPGDIHDLTGLEALARRMLSRTVR
jgi:anion-transporting  ArsA/GET3 family ATPase